MRVLIIALVGLTLVGCAGMGEFLDAATMPFAPATNFLAEE